MKTLNKSEFDNVSGGRRVDICEDGSLLVDDMPFIGSYDDSLKGRVGRVIDTWLIEHYKAEGKPIHYVS